MAFTTLLTTVLLITFVNAGFPAWNDDFPFPGYTSPMMSLRFASPQTMPGIPKFPFPFFGGFPFPTMPPMSFPAMPSVQDIANSMPANGGTYNGVMISTQSESKRNEDGTIVKKGGSTVMINDNGKVTVEKTGDSPPEIVPKYNWPMSHRSLLVSKKYKPLKLIDDFSRSTEIEPISSDVIKNYVPAKGELFTGHSVISHSYASDVNGIKKEGAIVSDVNNNNGFVAAHNYVFHSDGTQGL